MKRLALCLAIALVAGCGSDRTAGGGGIETNNTLGLRILDSTGTPQRDALVQILSSGEIDSGAATGKLRTGRTDKNGYLAVTLPDGHWTIEAIGSGTACLRTIDLSSDQDLGSIRLQPTARLTGNVYQAFPGQRVRVAVAGTTHSVVCDSSGSYSMGGLPSANLALKVVSETVRTDSVQLSAGSETRLPWTGRPLLRTLESAGSVLIEDFSASRPSISGADSLAGWYMTWNKDAGGRTALRRSDSAPDSVFSRFLVANAPVGQAGSFQAFFDIPSPNPVGIYPFAQAGISFHDSSRCTDLSKLDSITLLASGSDSVRLEFLGRLNYTTGDYGSNPGRWIRLDSSWKTIVIKGAELATPAGSTHPEINWSTMSGCVNELRFFTTHGAHLRMANLRFWGVPLSTFLHPGR